MTDRTSLVVAAGLLLLALLGIASVFGETIRAFGTSPVESRGAAAGEARR